MPYITVQRVWDDFLAEGNIVGFHYCHRKSNSVKSGGYLMIGKE